HSRTCLYGSHGEGDVSESLEDPPSCGRSPRHCLLARAPSQLHQVLWYDWKNVHREAVVEVRGVQGD
ncbi:hypothetical protein L915_10753, partial [Phytophthora nicotianae]